MPPPPILHSLSESRARAERTLILWIEQARAALGIRRGLHAPGGAGVYYKELSAERLARALSPRGEGLKKYRVTFDDGRPKQIVRCARERCYADLMGPEHLHRLERIAPLIRPGARLLEIASPPMLTGYTANWLARMVGDSGAVVTLIPDEEGAKFAPRRYARPNLSIERLENSLADALAGETDGAFDGVVHLGLPESAGARDAMMQELWRVIAPGGWMLAGLSLTSDPGDEAMRSLRARLGEMGHTIEPAGVGVGREERSSVLDVVLKKLATPVAGK